MMSEPAVNRDGEWVIYHARTGAVEERSESEARKRLDAGTHVAWPGAKVSAGAWLTAGEGEGSEAWPLKTPPDKYLETHPEGPNAALARRLVDGG